MPVNLNDVDPALLGDEELAQVAHGVARRLKVLADLDKDIKTELRRRYEAGTEEDVGRYTVKVSEGARRFAPDKVRDLLDGSELEAVSTLVPDKDLFRKKYGEEQYDLVCTRAAPAVSVKLNED